MDRQPTEARRRQIADAALAVIAEGGLARFTSLALARKVGLSDGALFRHFDSKDEIVLAAIERVEEILFGAAPPEDPEPIDRLRTFFRRRVALMRENPGVARLVTSDQLAQAAPPEGVAKIAALRQRSVGFVRACLEEAAAKGSLASGIATEEATVVVVGAVFALAHHPSISRARRPGDLTDRVWGALEIFLRGGAARPSAGQRPRAPTGVRARAVPRRRPRTGARR